MRLRSRHPWQTLAIERLQRRYWEELMKPFMISVEDVSTSRSNGWARPTSQTTCIWFECSVFLLVLAYSRIDFLPCGWTSLDVVAMVLRSGADLEPGPARARWNSAFRPQPHRLLLPESPEHPTDFEGTQMQCFREG